MEKAQFCNFSDKKDFAFSRTEQNFSKKLTQLIEGSTNAEFQ